MTRGAAGRGAALAAFALAVPAPLALAAWSTRSDPPYVASAPLAMRLDVERFLYLQVGTPGSTVDTVRFDLGRLDPALVPGGRGGATVASVTPPLQVIVNGNVGSISLSATTDGGGAGLRSSGGRSISYATLTVLSDNPQLPSPRLTDAGGATVVVPANAYGGRVTAQSARWTFVFSSPTLPAPGTYTGQVTYTASTP